MSMEFAREGLAQAGLKDLAERSHWFDISELSSIPEEVRDFGLQMALRGLMDIPYRETIFWGGEGDEEIAILCLKSHLNEMAVIAVTCWYRVDESHSAVVQIPFFIFIDTGETAVALEDVAMFGKAENFRRYSRPLVRMIAQLNGALLSKEVDLVRTGPSERKIRRDIKLGRQPSLVYHSLILHASLRQEIKEAIASGRASPRIHWRRGHFRDISAGTRERLIPIPPMIVGSKHRGMVVKDYKVMP